MVAAFIDGVVLILPFAILLGLLGEDLTSEDTSFTWVDYISFLIGVSYYTIAVATWSTTVGKRVLGIYVLRPDGSRVGIGRAFVRYLGYILSALFFFVGYLMIAFREDKRGLHDLICDTVVVYKR